MRASSVRATAHAVVTRGDERDQDLHTLLKQRVREPQIVRDAERLPSQGVEAPAHPSNRLIAQLSANWRVIDDPLQWILQRRKGNPRKKNFGWRSRSFCTTRNGLLRCVREYCGDIDTTALAKIAALASEHTHVDHTARKTVCLPKLQTASVAPGPAAASDKMPNKRMMAKD